MATMAQAKNTREKILDAGQHLVQTGGYSAMSYQDIAERVGIRKASIHYYFPAKEDLGRALVERYSATMADAMKCALENETLDGWALIEAYIAFYTQMGARGGSVCLCGALAGEFPALPANIKREVTAFFDEHRSWLANVMERGKARGDFDFKATKVQMAGTVLAALQGSLFLSRVAGSEKQTEMVVREIRAILRGER